MFSTAELQMLYRIGNAPINPFPYPHLFIRDVFPEDFYADLLRHVPPKEALVPLVEARKSVDSDYSRNRSVLLMNDQSLGQLDEPYRSFWAGVGGMLLAGNLGPLLMSKFSQAIDGRFTGQAAIEVADEALLVQDHADYSLGPHTDSPSKVFSLLFYLPADDTRAHLGTSIYVPKDRSFTCQGGPHYPFENFDRMLTMPYLPNTAFGFVKTPNAFHGVEPVTEGDGQRTLLLYDIRFRTRPTAPSSAATPASQFKF